MFSDNDNVTLEQVDDEKSAKEAFLAEHSHLTTAEEWNSEGNKFYNEEAYQKAFYCYEQAFQFDSENSYSLYSLGWLYQHGQGVENDKTKALEYHAKAAALGHTDAEKQHFILSNSQLSNAENWNNEGVKYYIGEKRPQDYQKARFCFEHVCTYHPSFALACYNLGIMHEQGQGIEKDIAKACEYHQRAIELKWEKSVAKLCNLVLLNDDTDEAEKVKYFDLIVKHFPLLLGQLLKQADKLSMAMEAFKYAYLKNDSAAYLEIIKLYQDISGRQEGTEEEFSETAQHKELACYFLGKFYQNKKNDLNEAKFYYTRFANKRHIDIKKRIDLYYQLGKIYEIELATTPTAIKQAIYYYHLAAEKDNLPAYECLCAIVASLTDQTLQAELYYKIAKLGENHLKQTPGPLAEAKETITSENVKKKYLLAAQAGNPDAQYALSLLLEDGKEIWRKKAIGNWLKLAEKELSITHQKDQAITDKSKAYTNAINYLKKAIKARSEAAKLKLKLLTNQLITTLLYQALQQHTGRQWNLKAEKCRPYLDLLKIINPNYSTWTVEKYKSYIQDEEKVHRTYFGEEVSDNSDDDEEKSFQNLSLPVKQATFAYSRGIFHKANLSGAKTILQSIVEKKKQFEKNKPVLKTTEKIGKTPNPSETVITDLTELNHWRRLGKLQEGLKRSARTRFVIAQYRGITYKITDWRTQARREHRNMAEIKAPLFSASVYKEANLPYTTNCLENKEANAELLNYAKELKKQLLALRKTGSHFKKCKDYKYQFDSVYDCLQQEYTKDYDKFGKILAEGKITSEKKGEVKLNLPNASNPFLSTGDTPLHALKYAYGIKPYEGHQHERIHPRWRKDEKGQIGQAEWPYSGKLYVTLHSVAEYYQDTPVHIISHNHLGRLRINDNAKGYQIINERETTFPAYIPEGRVFHTHIAKYPSFNGPYKSIYASKYGLDKEFYNLFQQALRDFPPGSVELESTRVLLGEYLCHYHQFRLLDVVQEEVKAKNMVLVYVDERGDLSLNLPPLVAASAKNDTQARDNLANIRKKRQYISESDSSSASEAEEQKEGVKRPRIPINIPLRKN